MAEADQTPVFLCHDHAAARPHWAVQSTSLLHGTFPPTCPDLCPQAVREQPLERGEELENWGKPALGDMDLLRSPPVKAGWRPGPSHWGGRSGSGHFPGSCAPHSTCSQRCGVPASATERRGLCCSWREGWRPAVEDRRMLRKVEGAAPSQRRCRKGPAPPNSAHLPVAQRRPFQGLPAWGVNKERGGKILSPEKSVV